MEIKRIWQGQLTTCPFDITNAFRIYRFVRNETEFSEAYNLTLQICKIYIDKMFITFSCEIGTLSDKQLGQLASLRSPVRPTGPQKQKCHSERMSLK